MNRQSQAKQDGFRAILFDHLFSSITLKNASVWDTFSDLGLFLEILSNEQHAKLWIQQSIPPGASSAAHFKWTRW